MAQQDDDAAIEEAELVEAELVEADLIEEPVEKESIARAAVPAESPPPTPPAAAGAEQREHPRYELTAYVDYTGSEVLLYHNLENLSLGGPSISTTALEEIGTEVELLINFPELDQSVAVEGEVVWVNREEPPDMGIRFVGLDEERRGVLRDYIQQVRQKRK